MKLQYDFTALGAIGGMLIGVVVGMTTNAPIEIRAIAALLFCIILSATGGLIGLYIEVWLIQQKKGGVHEESDK